MSQFESIEPDVLPPEDDGNPNSSGKAGNNARLNEAQPYHKAGKNPSGSTAPQPERRGRGPGSALVGGMLLDAADAITKIPAMGMVVGAALGLYLCIDLKIPPKRWGWVIAGAGIYCAVPWTNFIPLGTVFMLSRGLLEKWAHRHSS